MNASCCNVIAIIIIIVIKAIYIQDHLRSTSCVLKVSTATSVDHNAAGRLFHVDGLQTAKVLSL